MAPSPNLSSPDCASAILLARNPSFVKPRALRATVLRHAPGHIQRTTAYFLGLGHYDALIRKMRNTFQERREIMAQGIKHLGLETSHASVYGGTSFWMQAPSGVDTAVLADDLRAKGVIIEAGAAFFADATPQNQFYRLAYSSIGRDKIPGGLEKIAQAISRA